MVPENDNQEDEERTITEIGRELLKYLHRRLEELGTNQASYRQARMELLKTLEDNRARKRFNWGFEAVFTQEIHTLEELGLVSCKYGSGAIMAGRTSPNQIYNVSLTTDGKDTARVILEREHQHRKDTARLSESQEVAALPDDEDDNELDETDEAPVEESTKVKDGPPQTPHGKVSDKAAKEAATKVMNKPPLSARKPTPGLPGDHAAHDPEASDEE